MEHAMMKLCPTSSPLMPARMLMLFVQNIESNKRYVLLHQINFPLNLFALILNDTW
jgi:hypothetical protein